MTSTSIPPGLSQEKLRVEFNPPQLVLVDQLAQALGLTRNAVTFRALEAAVALYDTGRGRRFALANAKSERMREIEIGPTIRFSEDDEKARLETLRKRGATAWEPSSWTRFWIRCTPAVESSEFLRVHGKNAPALAVWIAWEVVRATHAPDGALWELGFVVADGFERAEYTLPRGLPEKQVNDLMEETLLWFDERNERPETWVSLYDIFSSRQLGIGHKILFARDLDRAKLSARDIITYILQISCVDEQDLAEVTFDQLTWEVGLDQSPDGATQ